MFEQITPQTALLVAFLAAFPPTIAAILSVRLARGARKDVHELHLELNSRLSELIESRTREADAAGEARGRQHEHKEGEQDA